MAGRHQRLSVPAAVLNESISTDRVVLVPLRREHADDLFPILADIALYEFTNDQPPVSVETLRARYAALEARHSPDGADLWLNWALCETATGESIGYVQATVTPRHADVAWVVGAAWQRRGYATEAARALVDWLRSSGVRAIRARIHPLHTASQRVAANVGLSRTPEIVDGEDVWTDGNTEGPP